MSGTSSRMLTLLSLLQAHRDWPGGVLAERLGVTTRTVRRDVDRLRELGYHVRSVRGVDGGYRLEPGSRLPPLLLDDDQAVALAIALQHVPLSGADVAEAADRALATVRQTMPSRLRHRVDGVAFGHAPAGAAVDPALIEAVAAAVRERRVLRFDHAGSDGPARRAEPHGLVARRGRWYLVAWDLDRADWRLFRLDRMSLRTPGGPRFSPRPVPSGDAASFVEARTTGTTEGGRWPCVGRFEVDLPVSAVEPWAGGGDVEATGEGTTRVTAGSWSWPSLVARILQLDAEVRILGPDELVEAARTASERLTRSVSSAC